MKKLLALILALVMVLSLAACGGKDKNKDDQPEAPVTTGNDTLTTDEQGRTVVRVGIQSAPTTLAPWEAMSMGGIATRRSIYEFLVDKAGFGGEMVGVLMESYEKVDDTTYNVTIYDYIKDTAGNHMTAEDVAFSYMTAKEGGKMGKLSAIESVTAISDYTAQFKFTAPLGLGDLETLWSEAPVVTKAAYEASADKMTTNPVGTTAYRVASYVAGASITLEKTGEYWQTDESKYGTYSASNVDVIKYVVIPEQSQMTIALETGTIDISANIAADDVDRFEGVEGYKVSSYTDNTLNVLLPNCSDSSPLANQALREAVFYAVNSQDILDAVFGGEGLIAKSAASSIYGDFDPAMESDDYFAYNVETAKQKLADAGYKEGELKLDLLCNNYAQSTNMATIVQGFLRQIGVDVEIHAYENAMYQTLMDDPAEWDLALDAAGSSDYLINLWKLMYDKENNTTGGTSNYVMDDELQELLDTAATLEGHTKENMVRINEILTENAYAYALFNYNAFIAHSDAIETVSLDFRNQIMPHCCTYNTNVESVGSIDDIINEDPQPGETEEPGKTDAPSMDNKVDAADVAGTYAWSIDPGFGFVATYTGVLNADGTYEMAVTGMPNGDQHFAGTFETDGKLLLLGATTGEDQHDPADGICEEDGTSWWVITGSDSWVPYVAYDPSAEMTETLTGSYTWSIDPGFGFVMVMTGSFKDDGTYVMDVTGLPNGDLQMAGEYAYDGKQVQLVTNTGDAYDAAWAIEEADGTSWWVITGADSWCPKNHYTAPTLTGSYTWSIDPGFGFVMVMTGSFKDDGTYVMDVTGLPNGDLKMAGEYAYDGEQVQLVTNTGDAYDAAWGIQEADGSSWWVITGDGSWCPKNQYVPTLTGSYTWSIDPGFGFVMVMTGNFKEDGTYVMDVTGLPNGNLQMAGTYVYDGEQVQLATNTGDAYDAAWGIQEADGSSWWIITGENTWVPRNQA